MIYNPAVEQTSETAGAARRVSRGGWAALAVGVAAILGSLPLTWFASDSEVRDEFGHIPLVRRWVNTPETVSIARFPEPKGVALFAASAAWGRLFGTSCPALRSMIVILAILTLAAWTWLAHLWGLSRRFTVGISILVVPYFFIYTQMLYTEIPALLLTFLGLICAEKLRRGGLLWSAGVVIFLGLLLWVRQTFLVVPVGLLLCSPWMGRHRWHVAAAAAVACLAVVPMLFLWGGIVPPGEVQRFSGGGLYLDAFAFALGVLGALGWPALLIGLPRRQGREIPFLIAGLAAALILFILMPLDYTSAERGGHLQKALISMPLPPPLLKAILLAAMCAGGLVLGRLAYYAVFPDREGWLRLAAVLAVLSIMIRLVATPIFYDRYLILALVMVFAMAAQRARRPLAVAFICFFALVTIAHTTYVTYHPRPSDKAEPLWSKADLQAPPPVEARTGRRGDREGACHGIEGQDRTGDRIGPADRPQHRDLAGAGRGGRRGPLPPFRRVGPADG